VFICTYPFESDAFPSDITELSVLRHVLGLKSHIHKNLNSLSIRVNPYHGA